MGITDYGWDMFSCGVIVGFFGCIALVALFKILKENVRKELDKKINEP